MPVKWGTQVPTALAFMERQRLSSFEFFPPGQGGLQAPSVIIAYGPCQFSGRMGGWAGRPPHTEPWVPWAASEQKPSEPPVVHRVWMLISPTVSALPKRRPLFPALGIPSVRIALSHRPLFICDMSSSWDRGLWGNATRTCWVWPSLQHGPHQSHKIRRYIWRLSHNASLGTPQMLYWAIVHSHDG